MANILKKLIAGISTAAILATMAVPVALADDGDVLETWDYTAADATADWTLSESDVTQSITDNALVITNVPDKGRTAKKEFSNAITSSAIMEYDIQVKANGAGTQTLYIGASTSDYLVRLQFPQYGASVKVNDADSAAMTSPGDRSTPWMHIKHTFNFVTDQIDTEITYEESGAVIYSGTTGYGVSGASESIAMMQINFQKASARLSMKKLVVTEHEIQLTDEELLESIMSSFALDEDQRGLTSGDGFYTVTRDITLPSNVNATSITWELTQRAIDDEAAAWSETSFAAVKDDTLVLSATDDSANYYVKAAATVAVNDATDTREYLFVVTPLTNNKYPGSIEAWDYEFDNADWTISGDISQEITESGDTLKISNGSDKNTYTAYKNFTDPTSSSAKVEYDIQVYSRGDNANTVYIGASSSDYMFKMAFPKGGSSAIINGGDTAALSGGGDYTTPWIHVENTFNFVSNTVKTVITNESGNELYSGTSEYASTITETISRFTIDLGKYNSVSVKDIVVWPYEVTDQEIVDYSKSILEITDITKTDDVYTATRDFILPDAPTGTTVTWKVMQKAKDAADWTESSFITVSGANAIINPTSDIDNYDVKLVASITSGEASAEKDFVINLPNPSAEIAAFIGALLPVVNTTDKDAENNTITFDLSGTDVLKYDLSLPISSKTYKNTTAVWTSSDSDRISIAADGTATIMTSDLNTHDVTLTAVVTYKKGNITYSSDPQAFTVKMGYTSDDVSSSDATLGKYKVRFDKAYDANFSAIPSNAASNITFPSKGYFGSDFTWNSSVPTVISNQGKLTKASTAKTVILTASIVSGAASDTKQLTVSVAGTGSAGGGGGGSTSSTGTPSKSTGSGSIATSTTTSVAGSGAVSGEEVVERLVEEAAQSQDLFKDLSSAAWAREAINGLAKAGVVNGVSDTEFAPNATVTRAQFAKMLMGAFGLTTSTFTTSSFGDVATDAWYFDAVETAYNLGIINGIEDGVFAPDALITRQDMAVMVTRAAEAAEKTIPEVSESKSFDDAYRISDYATAAVDTLVKAGIINGMSDTEFAPLDNATRAQAAKILYNFL